MCDGRDLVETGGRGNVPGWLSARVRRERERSRDAVRPAVYLQS